MGAMVWPWGRQWPATPQMIFFALGTLWFVTLAVRTRIDGHAVSRSGGPHCPSTLPHAVMTGTMVWMLYATPSSMTAQRPAGGSGTRTAYRQ